MIFVYTKLAYLKMHGNSILYENPLSLLFTSALILKKSLSFLNYIHR